MYVNYANKVCENLQTNIGAPMGIHNEKRARERERKINKKCRSIAIDTSKTKSKDELRKCVRSENTKYKTNGC